MKPPSFDNWTIIFLLFAFLGIVTSILLQFQNKQNRIGKILISIVLVLFSITLIEYVLYWTRYIYYFPIFSNISLPFYFAYGPLLYIYVNEAANNRELKRKSFIHFIPLLIAFLICLPFYLYNSDIKKELLLKSFSKDSLYPYILQSINLISIVHMLVYSYCIFNKRKAFNEFLLIKKWVTTISVCLFGLALSMITYVVFSQLGILKLEWDYMISFSMSIFIGLITIASYVKPQVFNDIKPFSVNEIPSEITKYKNSPIDNSLGLELSKKLHQTMMKHFLWQKNDLRLEDLAKKMELPKHYISQVINEQFNMNFFEFVNKYRIEEAKTLIQQNKQSTLIEVAYQVGFNNKVSFGKAFKNNSGLSPLEYKKKISR